MSLLIAQVNDYGPKALQDAESAFWLDALEKVTD